MKKNILSYKWFNNLNKTAKRALGIVFTYITAILITYLIYSICTSTTY
mgnify:CR=1 FL=1